MSEAEVLWAPSRARIEATALHRFTRRAPGSPGAYADLWHWSIDQPEAFWAQVWDDCGVTAHRRYDRVLDDPVMPGARWFPGAELNLAGQLLARTGEKVALVGAAEGREDRVLNADELRREVAAAQRGLRALGVESGDRVAGLLPNGVEAVVLALAATGLGAIWSSCSPDFGAAGVVDRFGQIAPKVLCVADGYRYAGKVHTLADKVRAIVDQVPVDHLVLVDFAGVGLPAAHASQVSYADLTSHQAREPIAVPLPPDHPLYVMYSSGTTGVPKSIVHGHGGVLLTHLKEHQLQCDIRPGDVVLWFTTCGWMMWNWLLSALGSGAAIVCYDGSPTHPSADALWQVVRRHGVTHLGTSPKLLGAWEAAGLRPADGLVPEALRTVLSTGSPLNPAQFDWVYGAIGDDLHLASVSGGTDILGCFVGGVPTEPVRRGEIQGRALGMAVEVWDPQGRPITDEPGELVCTRPFPSMPVGFWDDPDGARYRKAYFTQHPGVWTHGDLVTLTASGGLVITGRSDTVLNPGGVRIGTAEVYRAVEPLAEVIDAIAVGRPVDGDVEVVLCLQLADGVELDDDLRGRIRLAIREATTPRHVPAHIVAVPGVPYTLSGKKVEGAVRDVLTGAEVVNRDALADPDLLDAYAALDLG